MLFRFRPRQTWMPYSVPRPVTQQERYNLRLQDEFESTRRADPGERSTGHQDVVADLKELAALRSSGALSSDEFDRAKAALLGEAPVDG